MKCIKCHKELMADSKFCTNCGARVEIAKQEEINTQVEAVEQEKVNAQVETAKQEEVNAPVETAKQEEVDAPVETVKQEEGTGQLHAIKQEEASVQVEEVTKQVEATREEGVSTQAEVIDENPASEELKVSEATQIPKIHYILWSVLGGMALVTLILLIVVNIYKNQKPIGEQVVEATSQTVQEEKITSIVFEEDDISLNNAEKKKLEVKVYPSTLENVKLQWESSNPEGVSIDQNGLVMALKEGAKAVITVKDAETQSIVANCNVSVRSKKESFLHVVQWLNTNEVALSEIDVYADNYKPNTRDYQLTWDEKLFYKLEDIDQTSSEDGLINSYTVEKKQLINKQTGNLMEYEVYSHPTTNEVHKIVSIEYIGDTLEIIDYYYDQGKVSFIFKRQDSVYTPTYASPDKVGERYYFNNDVMTKWRVINEPLNVVDYTLQKGDNLLAYDDLTAEKKGYYDEREKRMLNAAYNTYEVVLQAPSIGYIKGYVTNIDGYPMQNVSVKVLSEDYKVLVADCVTDYEGYYNVPVPTTGGIYRLVISYDGYVTTTIYNIDMNNGSLGAYQENVYLVPNNGANYEIQVLLSDAFNKLDMNSIGFDTGISYYANNDMVRLSNATLKVRSGMNNRNGEVYTTAYADEYGVVQLRLPAGTYTGEIIKSGYVTSYFTIVSKANNDFIQSTTTPVLGEDEVRIVLTWGSNPSDLDSHLFTPYQGESGDMQHIGYVQKSDSWGNNLDVDDTSSYGPETITIGNLGNGSYKYYVADYTNCSHGNYSSTAMSLSNAKVSVYTKDGLVQVFNVPRSREGVIWEVFEIRNKQIVPIQRYYSNITDKPWWNSSKW